MKFDWWVHRYIHMKIKDSENVKIFNIDKDQTILIKRYIDFVYDIL